MTTTTRHAATRLPALTEALEQRQLFCDFGHPSALPFTAAHIVAPRVAAAEAAGPSLAPGASGPLVAPVRIDAGGGPHTDVSSATFAADSSFTGGTASALPYEVANTTDDALYLTRRWGNFDYAVDVPSGTYDVRMHFADPLYTEAGKRTFNVTVEGAAALSAFDIAANGGGRAAIVRSVVANVTDGTLNLAFRGIIENAIVSAIEVVPRPGPAPMPGAWTDVAPALVPTFESQAAAVNGKMYVFGGFYDALVRATTASQVYDPAVNAWTRLADLPQPVTHAGTAAEGQTVWLAGGFVGDFPNNPATREVWKYDVATDTWSAGPALPKALSAGALVRVGRTLHYFGGVHADDVDSAEHYVLDLDKPTGWGKAAPLPNPRNHLGGITLGNKMYAIGGQHQRDETRRNVSDVHAYDVATDTWTLVSTLPIPRSHITASTFIVKDRILIAGGVTNGTSISRALADLTEFDPATGKWTELDPLPGIRKAPVARFLAGRIIVATGSIGAASPQTTTWTRSR